MNASRWFRTMISVVDISTCTAGLLRNAWSVRLRASRRLRSGLEDDVERGLRRATHGVEGRPQQTPGEPVFTGLRAEPETDLLGQRARGADDRGKAVVGPSDRVQVLLESIAGVGLHQEQGAVRSQSLMDVASGAHRVAHVVQGVEEADHVVAMAGEVLGRRDVEGHPRVHTGLNSGRAGAPDRRLVDVEAGDRHGFDSLAKM